MVDRPPSRRRLSPLTVPYRVVERGLPVGFAAAAGLQSGMARAVEAAPFGAVAVLAVPVLALLFLLAWESLRYRRFVYAVTDGALLIESGVLSRREREVPLRRVQNVDVTRNVVQRALGIATVNVETAGGSGTEVVLRYVDATEARRLQQVVREGFEDEATAEEAADDAPEELFALSARELALVGLLSFDLRVPAAVVALVTGSAPLLSTVVPVDSRTLLGALGVAGAAVVVAVLAWLAGAAVAVVNYYGFRLTREDEELRYERGLLRRYAGSIPTGKVQSLTVEENPLMRRFGYASLVIETAGYGPGGGEGSRQSAVPLAAVDRVADLARELEPYGDPTFAGPPRRVRRRYAVRYLLALLALVAALYGADRLLATRSIPWFLPLGAVVLVPVAAHYTWVHRGYWLGEEYFLTRTGFWKRRTKVVPHYRVQTVIESRTVFQRRWSVATVVADTAGSLSLVGGDAAARDIEATQATRLRGELDRRLRRAVARRRERRGVSGGPTAGRETGAVEDTGDGDGHGADLTDDDIDPADPGATGNGTGEGDGDTADGSEGE